VFVYHAIELSCEPKHGDYLILFQKALSEKIQGL